VHTEFLVDFVTNLFSESLVLDSSSQLCGLNCLYCEKITKAILAYKTSMWASITEEIHRFLLMAKRNGQIETE
jgi:hypothetical protein